MSLPSGFYRANGPLLGPSGAPVTGDPWKNKIYPCFVRCTGKPLSDLYATGRNPSLAEPGYFAYCGPMDLQYWQQAASAISSFWFSLQYNMVCEPILVHPNSQSYPWPTMQGHCYDWQWESGRPTIYTARWDGQNLRYVT